MKKYIFVIIAFIGIVFFACKHSAPEQPAPPLPDPGGNGGGQGGNPICFENDILTIFQKSCATPGCHDASSKQKGYILDSYDNLFKKDGGVNSNNIRPYDPVNSKLYKVLFDHKPPLNPDLTTEQKNLIARWIKEGAKNTINCTINCDSSEFKFSANIQPLLQNHCTGCHSGSNPPNGVDLTNYTNVHDFAMVGLLYGVVAHLPGYAQMPKGTGKLSDCEIAQIRQWVDAGAPDN